MTRLVIFGLSCFAVGVMGYLALRVNLVAAVREGDWRPIVQGRRPLRLAPSIVQCAYASARGGTAVALGLIAEAVIGAPTIPLDARAIVYMVALVLAFTGYMIVALDHRGRHDGDRQS